jgi:hypothetical protein
MSYRTDVDVVEPTDGHVHSHATTVRTYRPSPAATLERLVIFVFSLIEIVIVLRIVLLLFAARESNAIVSFVYSVSEVFVAPFRGILRIDEVQAGATALDIGAIVALVGWLILELIIIALLRVFRPRAEA